MKVFRVQRRADDRGAALVEFALILPILVALLLGMITTGVVFNQEMQLTHAAREGARYGAAIPIDQEFSSGTWASNVRDLIIARSDKELGGTGTTVCVSLVEGSYGQAAPFNLKVASTTNQGSSYYTTKADGTPCIPTETYPGLSAVNTDIGRRVQVVVSKPGKIEAMFMSWNVTLDTEATAKSEVDQ